MISILCSPFSPPYMGRLTSLQAPNGTQRTKTWNASAGTLDGYNWNVAGKTARGLGWDVRGNLISQSKDGFNSSYVYDQLSRLEYAQEGGNIETLTDSTMPQGSQQRDVAGIEGLDYSNPGATVKLDYYSSRIGVDLSSSQNTSKVRLIGVSPRIQPRTVEVYISQDGVDNDWQKLTDTTWLQDETGVTLQLGALHQAQFVKLHMTWDERDQNNQPVDQHTLAGTVGQLLQVWYDVDGQTTSFTYDSLGNRVLESQTRAHSVQTDYSYYPNSSRIQQAGTWEFDYDANGNMTSRGNSGTTDATTGQFDWNPTQGELWLYGYDLKNRLVSVQHGLAGSASLQSVAQYTYDIRDLRVETVKPVTTTYTQYDQSGDLLWHDNGTQTRKYIEALGQTWAEVRATGTISQVYFHSTDHEGSTDVITDSSGNIVWDGEYEAFGSVVRSNGTIRFDASYTGKEFDVDTGLYYFNARWYDPALGRFITEDPARSGDNWFAYCNNDPLGLIDPSGLDPITSNNWKKDPTGGLGVGAPGQRPGWHFAHIEGNPVQVPNGYKVPDVGGAVATGDELLFVGGAEAVGKGAFKGAEKLISKFGEKAAAAGEKEAVKAAEEGAKTVAGEFNVFDWSGYPEGVPKPEGALRVLEGSEYDQARAAANSANRSIHTADPSLAGKQIHEVQPVKFGGSPTDPANKVPLDPGTHSIITSWWNSLLRSIK